MDISPHTVLTFVSTRHVPALAQSDNKASYAKFTKDELTVCNAFAGALKIQPSEIYTFVSGIRIPAPSSPVLLSHNADGGCADSASDVSEISHSNSNHFATLDDEIEEDAPLSEEVQRDLASGVKRCCTTDGCKAIFVVDPAKREATHCSDCLIEGPKGKTRFVRMCCCGDLVFTFQADVRNGVARYGPYDATSKTGFKPFRFHAGCRPEPSAQAFAVDLACHNCPSNGRIQLTARQSAYFESAGKNLPTHCRECHASRKSEMAERQTDTSCDVCDKTFRIFNDQLAELKSDRTKVIACHDCRTTYTRDTCKDEGCSNHHITRAHKAYAVKNHRTLPAFCMKCAKA